MHWDMHLVPLSVADAVGHVGGQEQTALLIEITSPMSKCFLAKHCEIVKQHNILLFFISTPESVMLRCSSHFFWSKYIVGLNQSNITNIL